MKKTALVWFWIVGLLVPKAMLAAPPSPAAEQILIGTASPAGVYYYAGRAICRLVNTHVPGIRCKAVSTPGSLHNLSNVRGGALDLGIVQSDWQYHAVKGSGPVKFMDVPFGNLRALFSLHGEPFTLMVRRDSGIRTLEDLKGRRVNIGNPGSGQRATMEVVMNALGWTKNDFQLASELSAAEQSLALCHNRIEAMIYTVGHPNVSISKAAGLCDAILVPVTGPAIDKLVKENPYYAHTTIPAGMYSGTSDDIPTFGVKATVVTSADVSADTVRQIVKAVFDHLDALRRMHPAFGALDAKNMVSDGLTAPLHEGAKQHYLANGLL